MTLVIETAPTLLHLWQGPEVLAALTRLLGEAPDRVEVERTHFPEGRPVQPNLRVSLPSGRAVQVLAEYCPDDPQGHARQALASLGKSRNGQKAGLTGQSVVVAEDVGLVLRRPGLDERLPGLRLLHETGFARRAVKAAVGRDPGRTSVALVAHRLGKRAVLRISSADGVIYARLRAIKSDDGAVRLARHKALWGAAGAGAALRVPEPLGTIPELGVSIFAELPGRPMNFGGADDVAIAGALAALQAMALQDLPRHTGRDEARLLAGWQGRCRIWRPDIARRLDVGLRQTQHLLASSHAMPRPCHRDLHEKQILIADGVAGLLDLDTLCLADPALDGGNLMAHLFMAGRDEGPLRTMLDCPGLGLWRRAALIRLAMISAFKSTPDAALDRLIAEAMSDAGH